MPVIATIDDFEEQATLGDWYTFYDATGMMPELVLEPVTRGAPSSTLGLQFSGSGQTGWGAGVGIGIGCTDVSAYQGISFWAIGNTPVTIQVAIPETQSGDCPASTSGVCYSHPQKQVTVSSRWQQFYVPWADFAQQTSGNPGDLTTRQVIMAVQFSAFQAKDVTGEWQFVVDDLAFYSGTSGTAGFAGAAGASGAGGV
jgi:hypothetical protein